MIFLDTSGLLAAADIAEPRHQEAIDYFNASTAKLTHGYVIAEFVALAMVRGFPRSQLLDVVEAIQSSTEVEVVHVNPEIQRAALGLLRARLDKEWSLCDAVSFVLMQQRKIREALTTDHHFEQAGFIWLLRES